MKLLVVVPTVDGRQQHLARCIQSYTERSEGVLLRFEIVPNMATCGIAWQHGVERGLAWEPDFVHLTADDIMPGVGWLTDAIATTGLGAVPAGLVCEPEFDVLDPETGLPFADNRLNGKVNYFEGESGPGVIADGHIGSPFQYPSVPFCTRQQWDVIGPMIASHYGTDKWFGQRAAAAGMSVMATRRMLFYHYVAHEGRIPRYAGWLHTDLLDFDLNISYPEYVSGRLAPRERHPLLGTPEGRALARAWRSANVPGPQPWELEPDPTYH